ncbi:hypothetical protein PPL_05864 [Heterostelium album PN500]|uniref:Ankyrin repeat protein n=1 Tax=Heterostelium pallidum (strain ATCC 26659 / Pp 5 / PN500) TaxID=670386 RepID=D3BBJ6_HETP5|nr:hypothetical protein PPL_05864 [Heterostelium album PN500]EFA81029.1 hypothetical protein PPL_05864 [Heterostelium album PN500]|eukprot:XP_020433147.1 hypothetical protein PPL_05864 [Heterostelium album PN500]
MTEELPADNFGYCQTETIQRMLRYGFKFSEDLLDMALIFENQKLFKWLHTNTTFQCTLESPMDRAAEYGYIEFVKWLSENTTTGCTTDAMDKSAELGHFHILEWLHLNRSEGCTTNAMDNACHEYRTAIKDGVLFRKQLEMVKWLHYNRTEGCTTAAFDQAAKIGNLAIVDWLHKNRTEGFSSGILDKIALNGHMELVEWFEKNTNEEFDLDILDQSITVGNLNLVKYLHARNRDDNRYLFTTATMNHAIFKERLDIMEWLHSNVPEICKNTTIDKPLYYNYQTIKWLEEHRNQYYFQRSIDVVKCIEYYFSNSQYDALEWTLNNLSISDQQLIGIQT